MPGGKTNTERIETLEERAANMLARLDVQDFRFRELKAVLEKGSEAAERHAAKITVIEERILVLVDLKIVQAAITAIEKENLGFRKDMDALLKWKDDLKKEKEEASRRRWAFGPNITAAIISGLITLIGIGINYYLHRP